MRKPELDVPWKLPKKQHGVQGQIYPNLPRDAVFHQVLRETSKQESSRFGRLVSPETILLTMTLFPSTYTRLVSARMRERYKEIKKGNSNEKKSIDGIKPQRANQARVRPTSGDERQDVHGTTPQLQHQ